MGGPAKKTDTCKPEYWGSAEKNTTPQEKTKEKKNKVKKNVDQP